MDREGSVDQETEHDRNGARDRHVTTAIAAVGALVQVEQPRDVNLFEADGIEALRELVLVHRFAEPASTRLLLHVLGSSRDPLRSLHGVGGGEDASGAGSACAGSAGASTGSSISASVSTEFAIMSCICPTQLFMRQAHT